MCIRDRFNAALQNAKAVLEKADADQDEVDQAALALNTACLLYTSRCV